MVLIDITLASSTLAYGFLGHADAGAFPKSEQIDTHRGTHDAADSEKLCHSQQV